MRIVPLIGTIIAVLNLIHALWKRRPGESVAWFCAACFALADALP